MPTQQLKELVDKFPVLASAVSGEERTFVLKEGDSFGIFDRYGDMQSILEKGVQGLYHDGTRFLSRMVMLLEKQKPLLLNSNLREENELLTIDLANSDFLNQDHILVEKDTIHINRSMFLWKGVFYEKIDISNFGFVDVHLNLSFFLEADFADIFQVRGVAREKSGEKLPETYADGEFTFNYLGLDKTNRTTRIKFDPLPDQFKPGYKSDDAQSEGQLASQRFDYRIDLPAKNDFTISMSIAFEYEKKRPRSKSYVRVHDEMIHALELYNKRSCHIYTSNEQFNDWIARSKADLFTMITDTEYGKYPYAGVPWFSTPFGRDALVTAFECLWNNPDLAKGVLKFLAAKQATEINRFQDAEPGKILHEARKGEMAELNEIPFKQYYGSIDSTPLFIILACAYYKRTDDVETIKNIWPNIEKALYWINKYGDIDNDGFLEYEKKSDLGLTNQGWKDSHDSVFYENGSLAVGPIALCEVQGYVYDAKHSASLLAGELGHNEIAEQLEQEAETLKKQFEKQFWSAGKNTYHLALDGAKEPCNVRSSNAGHCLFSGIVSNQRAEKLVKTLFSPESYSGWGIRTVPSNEVRYNPMSYHNGSIWPHDNAIIAYGLARYGFKQEVNQLLGSLFDASLFAPNKRLPELFCGFKRKKGEGPTSYPVACSPQAWSSGAVYLLIRSFLGLEIHARENTIYFNHSLFPSFLDDITINNLVINGFAITFQIVKRPNNEISINMLSNENNVIVKVVN